MVVVDIFFIMKIMKGHSFVFLSSSSRIRNKSEYAITWTLKKNPMCGNFQIQGLSMVQRHPWREMSISIWFKSSYLFIFDKCTDGDTPNNRAIVQTVFSLVFSFMRTFQPQEVKLCAEGQYMKKRLNSFSPCHLSWLPNLHGMKVNYPR